MYETKANCVELTNNDILHLWSIFRLPMLEDASVDHFVIAVSVDYLIKPYEVFKEALRILKPGN